MRDTTRHGNTMEIYTYLKTRLQCLSFELFAIRMFDASTHKATPLTPAAHLGNSPFSFINQT